MVRRVEPRVITIKTPRKSLSIPNRLAQLAAKGENMAKVKRGRLVKRPRELTSTPRPEAISDKTVDRVVNGARKTIPRRRIPGIRKCDCFCVHKASPCLMLIRISKFISNMTRMRPFHLTINGGNNENGYARLSQRKYVIGLVLFIISVISKWIKDGMKTPEEKIAKLGLPLFPHKKK